MYLKWTTALLALATSTLGASSTDKAYNELITLSAKAPNGVIQLDSRTYDLLTSPARNWSAAVHFTALDPRRRCEPCKEFAPSFDKVGKAWSGLSPKSTRDAHFFGTLDFDNGQTVFQALNMMSAPVVHVYPATQGPHRVADQKQPFIKYDFSQGFEAAPLAEALSSHTPVTIPYREPIDYAKYATFAAALIPLGIAVRVLGPAFINRWTWAFTCIVTSLVMTSGFMFVRIRGMPQQAADGQWIAQGYQNQYGAETRVVAGIYGILGASFLMLTLVTPLQKSKSRQRIQVYLWSAVIFVVFSILISLFKVKNRGYPFKLLL